MKIGNKFAVFLCCIISSPAIFSAGGQFFNLQSVGQTLTLTLKSNLPLPSYTPGMRFNPSPSGFGLPNAATECSSGTSNGNCLFSLARGGAKNLTMSGPKGAFNMSLCLSGLGDTASCSQYTISGNRFIYIVNNNGGGTNALVQVCSMNAITGAVLTASPACTSYTIGAAGDELGDIAINPAGSYAYISNNNATNSRDILKCPINSTTGALGDCVAAAGSVGVVIDGPNGLTINPQGTYIYILDWDGQGIIKCSLSSVDGALSGCEQAATLGATATYGLEVNPAGTFLYVASDEVGNVGVLQCPINQSNGNLSTCVNPAPVQADRDIIGTPLDVALNSSGTLLYATNTADKIVMCSVNASTGFLSNCQETGPATIDNAILTINNGSVQAYIAPFTAGGGFTANTLVICPMSPSTGLISSTDCSGLPLADVRVQSGIALR